MNKEEFLKEIKDKSFEEIHQIVEKYKEENPEIYEIIIEEFEGESFDNLIFDMISNKQVRAYILMMYNLFIAAHNSMDYIKFIHITSFYVNKIQREIDAA